MNHAMSGKHPIDIMPLYEAMLPIRDMPLIGEALTYLINQIHKLKTKSLHWILNP